MKHYTITIETTSRDLADGLAEEYGGKIKAVTMILCHCCNKAFAPKRYNTRHCSTFCSMKVSREKYRERAKAEKKNQANESV